jgi:hypothetical protein
LVDFDLDDGKGEEFVEWARASGFVGRIIGVSSHEAGNDALLRAGADSICLKIHFSQIAKLL